MAKSSYTLIAIKEIPLSSQSNRLGPHLIHKQPFYVFLLNLPQEVELLAFLLLTGSFFWLGDTRVFL